VVTGVRSRGGGRTLMRTQQKVRGTEDFGAGLWLSGSEWRLAGADPPSECR
jgi:hypothetical protein